MIRTILTAVFALLLSTATTTASTPRKGIGCWRTVNARKTAASRMQQMRVKTGDRTHFTGKNRGLVILAEFTDKKFKEQNDREKYHDILNTRGYTTQEGFVGSVADYFYDQSDGQFELEFDVLGPYTTKYEYKHYGENDKEGLDVHPEEMIIEMCEAVADKVNFADYDWDGDGEVDEVFVVYAGKSESDTSDKNAIWPHMWNMTEAIGRPYVINGMAINVYACANELAKSGHINGIGTFCHEFSHCLGFPDFYDIIYRGAFGMNDFDLMSGGSHAGNGFRPVGYTAYEKMMCGWQEPIVLSDHDADIDSVKPISEHGSTYIIYNDAHPDEFYMIENRQKTGWDKSYPAAGMMITHVDFDSEVWVNNIPNTILTLEEALAMKLTCGNDHQRMTLFHADDDDDSKYWSAISSYYSKNTLNTDLYPYQANDSLTATSTPAATLFNKNSKGTKLMESAILDIRQNDDGTMSFRYRASHPVSDGIKTVDNAAQRPGIVYDLQGRRIAHGTSPNSALPTGIYIVNGKKYAKVR